MGDTPKKLTYLVYDGSANGYVLVGGFDELTTYLKAHVGELADGEQCEFWVTRHDMTQEEIEATPII